MLLADRLCLLRAIPESEADGAIGGDVDDEDEGGRMTQLCFATFAGAMQHALLHHLISDDDRVSAAQKKTLLSLCKLATMARFFAQTFLYACCQLNKSRIADLSVNDGWLSNKACDICPMCRKKPLTITNGNCTIPQYQAVTFPAEPGGNKECQVLVCVGCTRSKELQPTGTITLTDFRQSLSNAYGLNETGLTWREAVSGTFRIWQRDNDKPTLPLSVHHTDMLLRICQYLNCSLPDICEAIPATPKGETD